MPQYRWSMPLDPDCPENPLVAFQADPITQAYGLGGDEEFTRPMAAKHMQDCPRCQEYAAEHIEVEII